MTAPDSADLPVTRRIHPETELARASHGTVHVDKAIVGVDYGIDTATIILLNMHAIPRPRPEGEWGIESIVWETVGELKIPLNALNDLVCFYIHEISNGLDIRPLVVEHMKSHPRPKRQAVTFGPMGTKLPDVPRETTGA